MTDRGKSALIQEAHKLTIGPSSLIGCPNFFLNLKYLINFGQTIKLIKIEVIKAPLARKVKYLKTFRKLN